MDRAEFYPSEDRECDDRGELAGMLYRVIAVILGLCFLFMLAVDILVLTEEGSIKWGIYILYLIGTVILGYLTVWLWRRGKSAPPAV
jgi:hypothetical protein